MFPTALFGLNASGFLSGELETSDLPVVLRAIAKVADELQGSDLGNGTLLSVLDAADLAALTRVTRGMGYSGPTDAAFLAALDVASPVPELFRGVAAATDSPARDLVAYSEAVLHPLIARALSVHMAMDPEGAGPVGNVTSLCELSENLDALRELSFTPMGSAGMSGLSPASHKEGRALWDGALELRRHAREGTA